MAQRTSAPGVPKVGGTKDFQSLHPPEFDGSGGPLAAKDWIERVEPMLVAALVPEIERVNVLQIQLLGLARSWFDLLVQSH